MSRVSFNRKRVKLKRVLGIRGRLVLLALILVVPLMLERARSLEDARARQIAAASTEYKRLARHAADSQREVMSSVEAVMKSTAYIYAAGSAAGNPCAIMRASLRVDLPWIRNLSIADASGVVRCSTMAQVVGANLGERTYLKRALATRRLVLSDYLFSRVTQQPMLVAAYPVAAIDQTSGAVVVAALNLNWLSHAMNGLGNRPGITALLVDSNGVVLAAPDDLASTVTHPMRDPTLLAAVVAREQATGEQTGGLSHVGPDGEARTVSFARVPGTHARLIVSIDDAMVSAGINHEIRTAYAQLAFVGFLVLLGALMAAEGLIVKPIRSLTSIAVRFGNGDHGARATRRDLPAEFQPLARAFNAMAAQLGRRERELVASNNQLSVMASMDPVSGLANRRGFESRLDFEWLKAMQNHRELGLVMLDVDHFKLFNDTYGHPEGDACLGRIGAALADIATANNGLAARYGGEEFCILLPDRDAAGTSRIGDAARIAVQGLAIPHRASAHLTVTVSVGLASVRPDPTIEPAELIEAADAALYAAKRRGRNATVRHGKFEAGPSRISLAS